MKVYMILSQASYDDDFNIISIHRSEVIATEKAQKLQVEEKSKFVNYWVDEWEVEG